MAHPGFLDQPTKNDDAIREADQSVNDPCGTFGTGGVILESAVVPRIGSFYYPPRTSLQRFAFGTDCAVTPKVIEQVAGFPAVVPGI